MFVFVLSAILVQALIGANAFILPGGPGPVIPQEGLPSLSIPSFPLYNTEFALPSSLSIFDYAPAIENFLSTSVLSAPELSFASALPFSNPQVGYAGAYGSLPQIISEVDYTSTAARPVITEEVAVSALPYGQILPSPVLPSPVLPGPVLPSPILSGPGNYGFSDLSIAGELPLGGTASVNGAVPVSGALQFAGNVPAIGKVSLSCGCGNYQAVPIYY